jgi:hypothetical protein
MYPFFNIYLLALEIAGSAPPDGETIMLRYEVGPVLQALPSRGSLQSILKCFRCSSIKLATGWLGLKLRRNGGVMPHRMSWFMLLRLLPGGVVHGELLRFVSSTGAFREP